MTIQTPVSKAAELVALVEQIAERAYPILESLPESEQWDLQTKIRHEAVDALATISEACGALDPRDITWRLSQGRGHLSSLASLVKLARKSHGIDLNPHYMLDIKKSIAIIDEEIPSMPVKAKEWLQAYSMVLSQEDKPS